MFSILRTIWYVFLHSFQKRITVQYPEQKPYLAPRFRGRIILSRDPDVILELSGDTRDKREQVLAQVVAAAC